MENIAAQRQKVSEKMEEQLQSIGCLVSSRTFSDDEIANIARICHEANRAVCVINGDFSQVPWDEAPDWQKASCIDGVRSHVNNRFRDGREAHDNWVGVKLKDGWKYGPVKDAEKKEHPCLLPYSILPDSEKVKDDLFIAIVGAYKRRYQ